MTDTERNALLLKFAARPVGRLRWRIARLIGLWLLTLALHSWGVPAIIAGLVAVAVTFGPYMAWLNGRLAEALVCERKHGYSRAPKFGGW